MLRVLLVEDDHVQRNYVRQALADGLKADVDTKTCEWEFQRDFDLLALNPPDVAVLDIMLRWASPSKDVAEPPKDSTPYHAGLRCAKRLKGDPRTQGVKVILYSVLPKEDIPDPLTREEIRERLGLQKDPVFISSFDRPNIRYEITRKDSAREQLLAFIRERHSGQAGIVYCLSRAKTEETAEWLSRHGVPALCYHAGLPAALRILETKEAYGLVTCR